MLARAGERFAAVERDEESDVVATIGGGDDLHLEVERRGIPRARAAVDQAARTQREGRDP